MYDIPYTKHMIEIIPAINAENFRDVTEKIKRVEPYVRWVHIDVADGTFTKNILWHNAKDLLMLKTPLFIEVHLMVTDIEKKISSWLLPNVRRVIFHVETAKDPRSIVRVCHAADIEAGIAVHPDTSWEQLLPYVKEADIIQTLAVVPGHAGQVFQKKIIKKIEGLRRMCSTCLIEVDGGMNKETAGRAIQAGATHIVAASAIFNGGDIEKNIKDLQNI